MLLPIAAFTESAGTYINCEGRAQWSNVAASPKGQSRPAWKVLRVLGNFMDCDGFDQITLDDVKAEISGAVDLDHLKPSARLREWKIQPLLSGASSSASSSPSEGLIRIADMPMYRGDITLRNADALQSTADNPAPSVCANQMTADKHSLDQGDVVLVKNGSGKAKLPFSVNNRIPDNSVYIPAGHLETAGMGGHVEVSLEKA